MNTATREQRLAGRSRYYALGRFVEEFELMVYALRQVSLGLIPSVMMPYDDTKVMLILSHQSMTAGPLMQVMRGLLGETIRYRQLDKEVVSRLLSLMRYISKEHEELVSARNTILHGTWRTNRMDNSLEIYNFRGSLPGGSLPAPVAKTAAEFFGLAKRCARLKRMIERLRPTAWAHGFDPAVPYMQEGRRWRIRPGYDSLAYPMQPQVEPDAWLNAQQGALPKK